MIMKIKKNDNVMITTGKDRGKTGKVLQVLPKEDKVVVQSLNMRKVHARPKKQGEKGQIISKETPVNISNVMIVCPKCAKPARIGFLLEKGSKSRVCKKCKGTI